MKNKRMRPMQNNSTVVCVAVPVDVCNPALDVYNVLTLDPIGEPDYMINIEVVTAGELAIGPSQQRSPSLSRYCLRTLSCS